MSKIPTTNPRLTELEAEVLSLRQTVADRDAILSAVHTEWEAGSRAGVAMPLNIGRILALSPADASAEHEAQVERLAVRRFSDLLRRTDVSERTPTQVFDQIVALARKTGDESLLGDSEPVHPWTVRDRGVARDALHEFADLLLSTTFNLSSSNLLRNVVVTLARNFHNRA